MCRKISAKKGPLAGFWILILVSAGVQGCTTKGSVPDAVVTGLAVKCTTTQVQVGQSAQCSANVQGAGNFPTSVSWSVNGIAGGNAAFGTISAGGRYTAPSTVPSPSVVAVEATSVADRSKTGKANVAIDPGALITSVLVACALANVPINQTSQCNATVGGTGNFDSSVTWSVQGINGSTTGYGTIDGNGLYTAPATVPVPYQVVVTATSASDATRSGRVVLNIVKTAGAILLGGGTLTYVVDSSLTAPAIAYLQRLVADTVDANGGNLYGICGSAAAPTTIAVQYDSSATSFATTLNSSDGSSGVTKINILPAPDSSGIDKDFDHMFLHEIGLGLRLRTWAAPFASPAVFGITTSAPLADEEGFAETCSAFELKKLAQSGKRSGEDVNQGWQTTLLVDSFASFDSNATLGAYTYPGNYSLPFVYGAEAIYRFLIGAQGIADLAAFEDAYFGTLSAKQAALAKPDRIALYNSLGKIDGTAAGNWMPAHAAYLLATANATPETVLLLWVNAPQAPTSAVVQAATLDVAVDGTPSYTPVTAGPVTVTVADADGNTITVINTDLSASAAPGTVLLNLPNGLAVGGYGISASAEISCNTYTASGAFAIVPPEFTGSVATNQASSPFVYVLSVDGFGRPTVDSLNVTEGTVLYPSSGTTAGLVILQAGASGQVTVNGGAFTAPATGSRLVFAGPTF